MITELFNTPFNHLSHERLDLLQVQIDSPIQKNRKSSDKIQKNMQLRNEKLKQLSIQTQKLIQKIVYPIYADEINSLQKADFYTIKSSNDILFGEISICESSHSFFKTNSKVAEGLCEIIYENGSYLIGYFEKGSIQSEFIYILSNGNYIKCNKIKNKQKKSNAGFRTDDSDQNQQADHLNHSDWIEQSDVKISIFEYKLPINLTLLQCQILYNGIQFTGLLKNGLLHGKISQKGRDYKFSGQYYNGQRKHGNYISDFAIQYQGTFKNNKFQGLGTLKTNDGVYTGEFINGLKEGQGQFKWPDGSSYVGEFKKDKRHGKGLYKSVQGSFKGEWRNDQIQGTGYLILNGRGVSGQWRKDNFQIPNKFY